VDEFLAAQEKMSRPGVPGWWENMPVDADQYERLCQAAGNPTISHRAIATVLNSWGVKVTVGQVGHWRRNVVS
jgi:hypothetical protein